MIIVITGGSSGMGRLTAIALREAGHTVYAGTRRTPGEGQIRLDVRSQTSVDTAIAEVMDQHGYIDVLVHNAGHVCLGPAEAFTPEELAVLYDVNVLGTQRVNRAVLPGMRMRGRGLLVWVGGSSMRGGRTPFMGPYFAAKAAMDALAESYARELIRFGIDTTIVVPGAFASGTNHFAHAIKPTDTGRAAAYDGRYGALRDGIGAALAALYQPDRVVSEVAEEIVRVVGLPQGHRPFRTHIDPIDDTDIDDGRGYDRVEQEFLHGIGLDGLLPAEQRQPTPSRTGTESTGKE